MKERPNPYQAPQTLDELADAGPSSRVPLMLVATGACAYHLFIVLLLSSAGDRPIAALFFLNTPVVMIWIIGLLGQRQSYYKPGIVAAGVQLGIYVIAGGRLGLNDWSMINLVIIGVMLALAAVCYYFKTDAPAANSVG